MEFTPTIILDDATPGAERLLRFGQPQAIVQACTPDEVAPALAAIEAAGYGAVWRGQRTWNGVAILARGATPVVTRRALPGDPADIAATEEPARLQSAFIHGIKRLPVAWTPPR